MTIGRHITPEEGIDLLDGCASDGAHAHIEECAACRDRLAMLTASLAATRADRVPEPSPLFWAHFSARVSDAIRQPAEVRSGRHLPSRVRWWLCQGVAVVVLAGVALVVSLRQSPSPSSSRLVSSPPATAGLRTAAFDPAMSDDSLAVDAADGPWELVAALTADVVDDGNDLAGLEPVPGSADGAVDQLSGDEQGELVRLIEAVLTRRPG
jgi:hypothetical protein